MTTTAVLPRPSVAGVSRSDLTLTTDHLAGIGALRRRLTQALRTHGSDEDLIDAAALLATELLSNALRHADAGRRRLVVRLDMHRDDYGVTIAVTDPDPRPPVARTTDPDAESGRGMELLEFLATRWGTRHTTTGKTVWCFLT